MLSPFRWFKTHGQLQDDVDALQKDCHSNSNMGFLPQLIFAFYLLPPKLDCFVLKSTPSFFSRASIGSMAMAHRPRR
jgi:hypothetical protein